MPRYLHHLTILGLVLGILLWSPIYGTASVADEEVQQEEIAFEPNGAVTSLSRADYSSKVLSTRRPVVVWFYSSENCPPCHAMSGEVITAAESLRRWGVSMTAVDVRKERRLAKDVSLTGAPMFKVYHGEGSPNPYGGVPIRSFEDIFGSTDSRSIQRNIISAIPDLVMKIDLTVGENSEDGDSAGLSSAARTLRDGLAMPGEATEIGPPASHAAVLVTSAKKASPLLRVMASEIGKRVEVFQARVALDGEGSADAVEVTNRLLAETWGGLQGSVSALPALVMVERSAGKATIFEGDVSNGQAMLSFILEGAGIESKNASGPSMKPYTASGGGSEDISSNRGEDGSDSNGTGATNNNVGDIRTAGGLITLTPEMFSMLKEEGNEALVVAYVEGGEGERRMEEAFPGWERATKGLQGQIRAAVADCGVYPSLCTMPSKEVPQIRVYPHSHGDKGDDWNTPSVFDADKVLDAVKEAEESLPDLVMQIPAGGMRSQQVQEAFEGFMRLHFSKESGGAMVLSVLSNREEPNLLVKTIAAEFEGLGVAVLFISQPPQELVAGMGVRKLPGLVLMTRAPDEMKPAHLQETGDGTQEHLMTAIYTTQYGPLVHLNVRNFIMFHMGRVDVPGFVTKVKNLSSTAKLIGEDLDPFLVESAKAMEAEGDLEDNNSRGNTRYTSTPESTTPWGGVLEEATADNFSERLCPEEGARLCAVFLLDRLGEGHEAALEAAQEAVAKAVNEPGGENMLTFSWIDTPCQAGFADAVGLTDASAIPGLVVFSPRRLRLSRFLGAWESESMSRFLGGVLGGRVSTHPISQQPRLEEDNGCSSRQLPVQGGAEEGSTVQDSSEEDMEAFMAEIRAEEERAQKELAEEVERELKELQDAEAASAAEGDKPKKRTKIIKRRKKKGSKTAGGEL